MSDCLFCKIIEGTIPAKMVFQDEQVLAFEDINPQAPVHILVVPKRHVPSVGAMEPGDQSLLGHLMLTCVQVAKKKGVADRGYRIVANTGREGGQTVFHVHLHLLGGRALSWPPG